MRGVDAAHHIALDGMAGSNNKHSTELHTLNFIPNNSDGRRLHIGVGVVHHNSEMAVRVRAAGFRIETTITGHFPVMEAVQINAFSIDFFKAIARVSA